VPENTDFFSFPISGATTPMESTEGPANGIEELSAQALSVPWCHHGDREYDATQPL